MKSKAMNDPFAVPGQVSNLDPFAVNKPEIPQKGSEFVTPFKEVSSIPPVQVQDDDEIAPAASDEEEAPPKQIK